MKARSMMVVACVAVMPSLMAGVALASTPTQQPMSNNSQPSHTMMQQGERNQNPSISGAPSMMQNPNTNSADSAQPNHTAPQQGEKHQSYQN